MYYIQYAVVCVRVWAGAQSTADTVRGEKYNLHDITVWRKRIFGDTFSPAGASGSVSAAVGGVERKNAGKTATILLSTVQRAQVD